MARPTVLKPDISKLSQCIALIRRALAGHHFVLAYTSSSTRVAKQVEWGNELIVYNAHGEIKLAQSYDELEMQMQKLSPKLIGVDVLHAIAVNISRVGGEYEIGALETKTDTHNNLTYFIKKLSGKEIKISRNCMLHVAVCDRQNIILYPYRVIFNVSDVPTISPSPFQAKSWKRRLESQEAVVIIEY